MGTTWFVVLCILNMFQDPLLVTAEKPTCVPGFQSDQLTFSVIRKHLRRGIILGKVGFTDCTDRTRFLYSTSDSRFVVKTDGVLMVNRPVVLPEGHLDFVIHSWDPQGRKMTIPASVSMFEAHAVVDGAGIAEEPMEIIVNVIDQNDNKPVFAQSTYTVQLPDTAVTGFEVIAVSATDIDEPNKVNSDLRYRILSQEPQLPRGNMFVINPVSGIITLTGTGLDSEKYPQYTLVVKAADLEGEGLSAQATVVIKVTVVSMTYIFVVENSRGPFPFKLAHTRFDDAQVKRLYSITGPGADQPPVGLFTMDRDTGHLYITQPVDREERAKYLIQVRAVPESAAHKEGLTTLTVNVIDQNDNKPTFTQDTFEGEVPDSSVKGSEVIKVTATDIDEPNSGNSHIRYSIMSQEPQLPSDNMFEIDPINGVISVAGSGLNRDQHPQYTLVVKAADMVGEGLSTQANVILKVTDDITEGGGEPVVPGKDSRILFQLAGQKEQSDIRDIHHCNGAFFF